MPCPAFFPTRVVDERTCTNGRLPLIDEYVGVCTASADSFVPDRDTLFRCCNHGYSRGTCSRLPLDATISALRYTVTARTANALEILCVEEVDHEPRSWHTLEYRLDGAELNGDLLTDCIRAQAIAFCKAYVGQILPKVTLPEPN